MSHSFSFLVSRNTQLNKAAIRLSFLFKIKHLGNTMVVLFGDFFVDFSTIYNDVWRHFIGVSFNVEFNDVS